MKQTYKVLVHVALRDVLLEGKGWERDTVQSIPSYPNPHILPRTPNPMASPHLLEKLSVVGFIQFPGQKWMKAWS